MEQKVSKTVETWQIKSEVEIDGIKYRLITSLLPEDMYGNSNKYETMIFKGGSWKDIFRAGYYTSEAEAREMHEQFLKQMEQGEKFWDYD